MEENAATPAEPGAPKLPADAKYLLIVCGLLLMIVILLAVLWIRERRTTNDLRFRVDGMSALLQRQTLGGQIGQLLGVQAGPPSQPLRRDELATEVVTYDGRPRTVMLVGAAAGRRIGLLPGDVIAVSQPPAKMPTTEPETRPAP